MSMYHHLNGKLVMQYGYQYDVGIVQFMYNCIQYILMISHVNQAELMHLKLHSSLQCTVVIPYKRKY